MPICQYMNKYTSRVKKGAITSPNLNTEEGRGLKRVCLFLLLWIIQKYNLLSTDSLFCELFFIYFFCLGTHYTSKTFESFYLITSQKAPKLRKLISNIRSMVITQTEMINTCWSSECLVEIKRLRSVSIESVGGNIGFDFVYGCWAKSQNLKLGCRPQTQTPALCVPLRHLMD